MQIFFPKRKNMYRFLFTFWLLPKYGLCCGNMKTANYNIVLGNIYRNRKCRHHERLQLPLIDALLIFFILSFEFVMHFSLKNRKRNQPPWEVASCIESIKWKGIQYNFVLLFLNCSGFTSFFFIIIFQQLQFIYLFALFLLTW